MMVIFAQQTVALEEFVLLILLFALVLICAILNSVILKVEIVYLEKLLAMMETFAPMIDAVKAAVSLTQLHVIIVISAVLKHVLMELVFLAMLLVMMEIFALKILVIPKQENVSFDQNLVLELMHVTHNHVMEKPVTAKLPKLNVTITTYVQSIVA